MGQQRQSAFKHSRCHFNDERQDRLDQESRRCRSRAASRCHGCNPTPNSKSGWEFDTSAGRLEILYRRIGRNELDAIQASLAFVDAQNEYAEKDRAGEGVGVYAQRIVSTPGKKDGLFWRDDGDPSPLGELAARASSEGYKVDGQGAPYHGYSFEY